MRRREIPPTARLGSLPRRATPRGLTRNAGFRCASPRGRGQDQNARFRFAGSSVTHETMSDFTDAYFVFRHERVAERVTIAVRLPGHVSDLVRRPKMRRRIAVTIEAELHRQWLGAIGQRHLINSAVTLDAADAFRDMNVVAEKNIVGQHGDTIPR